MPRPVRSPLVLALIAVAVGVAACGSEAGTIPEGDAEALLQSLNEVQSSVEAGDCTSATTDATQFLENVRLLPKEVGEETKADLFEAADNLVKLTQDPAKCQDPDDEETTTTTTEAGATGEEGED